MMTTNEVYNLQRFLDAQSRIYSTALDELRAGRKTSHWMWFVFPQVAGLGRSDMAQRYAAYYQLETWRAFMQTAGFSELEHYYRPAGLPRTSSHGWPACGGVAGADT